MDMPKNFFLNFTEPKDGEEIFEVIHECDDFLIERIGSNNAKSPSEGWYEQGHNEWVMVLQGSAVIETPESQHELHRGDTLFIRAHLKHKVIYTSSSPVCIWIAVHSKPQSLSENN